MSKWKRILVTPILLVVKRRKGRRHPHPVVRPPPPLLHHDVAEVVDEQVAIVNLLMVVQLLLRQMMLPLQSNQILLRVFTNVHSLVVLVDLGVDSIYELIMPPHIDENVPGLAVNVIEDSHVGVTWNVTVDCFMVIHKVVDTLA